MGAAVRLHRLLTIGIPFLMRRTKALVAELGVLDASLYLLSRTLEKTTRNRMRLFKYFLVAQPVHPKPLIPESRRGAILVRIVDHIDPIVATFPRPREVINNRFRLGARCFVAEMNGRFAGFLWLKERCYEEDEVRCLFRPTPEDQAVWDFDVYIDPEFRLSRAFSRLWDAAYEFLRSRHYRWTTSRVSAFNSPSLKSHARLGAVKVNWIVFLVVGGCQVSISGESPFLHLSLSSASRPTCAVRVPIE